MNKKEINEWLKKAKYAGCNEDYYDENGNREQELVYKYDNKLYLLCFLNNEPCEIFGEHGYVRDCYEPVEVVEKTKIQEITYYEPIKNNSQKDIVFPAPIFNEIMEHLDNAEKLLNKVLICCNKKEPS